MQIKNITNTTRIIGNVPRDFSCPLETHSVLDSEIIIFMILMNNLLRLSIITNGVFATVIQMFGDSFQLPTTVERIVIKSLSSSDSETVIGSGQKLGEPLNS